MCVCVYVYAMLECVQVSLNVLCEHVCLCVGIHIDVCHYDMKRINPHLGIFHVFLTLLPITEHVVYT